MRPLQRLAAWCSAVGIIAVLALAVPLLGARTAPPLAREAVGSSIPRPVTITPLAVLPVPTPPSVEVPAIPTGAPVPVSTPSGDPTPAVLSPHVPANRAAVVVDLAPGEDEAAARALAQAQQGVVHVAAVTVHTTSLGGVPAEIAQVDPEEFRPFTPEATANHQPLWDRIRAGDVAVTHEFGTTHAVVLGLELELGDVGPQRVGAYATNTTPPLADAIVGPGTDLGEGARRLLIALDPEGSPTATVEALVAEGLDAEAIPDPRAPRDDIVIPTSGITPENVWDHLAVCEASGNWQINTGNGYYGGLQFLPESWAWVGGTGLPHEWPREEQIHRATLLWQIQGWEAWPQCARKLGLIVDQPAPEPTQ